jgi:cell division protein FtsW
VKKSAIVLIVCVALLYSFGLLMVFNTTAAEIIDRSLETNTHTVLYKQIGFSVVGVVLGAAAYQLGFERLLRWSGPILVFVTFLLVLVYVPGIGQKINGARRWLGVFGFSFQPSECAKIAIPAAFIHWVLRQEGGVAFRKFLQVLSVLSVPLALILFEPDNGTTVIILFCLIVLFLLCGIRLKYWAWPLLAVVLLGMGAAYRMPHVHDRIRVFLHPELDLLGKGHQPHQAKIAAGSGGLLGRGLGESLQKLNYLPEAQNDYVAAIYAEETGFIGMLALIGLYAAFTYAGISIALQAPSHEGFLVASILTVLIAIQAFLNLGIVSGLLPSKGMTLPFFSQGGTSLMVNIAAVFLLLDISRKSGTVYET